jgi:hypothetical protein
MNYVKSFTKQVLAGFIAIAMAAIVIALTAPKAVHAAVTALIVEVANTPTNPVPSADITRSASNLVTLYCYIQGGQSPCSLLEPGESIENVSGTYTVPAGQNLVVTDVEITGGNQFFVVYGIYAGGASEVFQVTGGGTHEFTFPHGFVWPAGQPLLVGGSNTTSAYIRGYLTTN